MKLTIDLEGVIRPDPDYASYDYKKFSVRDERGKFLTHIFEHGGEFINLKSSKFFATKEAAAAALYRS